MLTKPVQPVVVFSKSERSVISLTSFLQLFLKIYAMGLTFFKHKMEVCVFDCFMLWST